MLWDGRPPSLVSEGVMQTLWNWTPRHQIISFRCNCLQWYQPRGTLYNWVCWFCFKSLESLLQQQIPHLFPLSSRRQAGGTETRQNLGVRPGHTGQLGDLGQWLDFSLKNQDDTAHHLAETSWEFKDITILKSSQRCLAPRRCAINMSFLCACVLLLSYQWSLEKSSRAPREFQITMFPLLFK